MGERKIFTKPLEDEPDFLVVGAHGQEVNAPGITEESLESDLRLFLEGSAGRAHEVTAEIRARHAQEQQTQ